MRRSTTPIGCRIPNDPIVGSGPFLVTKYTGNQLQLSRYDAYVGRNPARLPALVYRSVADSPTIEDAMTRGHGRCGLERSRQRQRSPASASKCDRTPITRPSTASPRLCWAAPGCCNSNGRRPRACGRTRDLRQAIAVALQGDRTSDSIVPTGVDGHTAAFPLGGKAKPKVTWKSRINLTLGYDASMPNGQDLATQIRSRLENTGGLSVQLKPGRPERGPESGGPEGVDLDSARLAAALSGRAAAGRRVDGQHHRDRVSRDHRRVPPRTGCWPRCRSRRPWI